MRTKKRVPRPLTTDPIFRDLIVAKFVNYLMKDGKKAVAYKIVLKAFEMVKDKTGENPVIILKKAIDNTSPYVEVISRRIGGATYQVPKEVRTERRSFLAMRWLIETAREVKGKPMYQKLAEELIAAANNEGKTVKKKLEIQKIAEANKAFAHLAW